MTSKPPSRPLTLDEAEARLKQATFRIYLGKLEDDDGVRKRFFGTGFFVSKDGLALSAYHNFEGCSPNRIFRAELGGERIRLRWDKASSSEKSDIAVLRLHWKSTSLRIEPLAGAYIPAEPAVDAQVRKAFFRGRRVAIYGFPQRERSADGWLVPTEVDEAQSIFASWEGGQWVDRLSLHGGARADKLEGISGAAILDRKLRKVIGVEGSYRPGPSHDRQVYGSELALLVEQQPDLAAYFCPLDAEPPPEPTKARFPVPRWWREFWALRRYRQHLKKEFKFFNFLRRADPLELDRVYLELKVHRFVPPEEKSDAVQPKPSAANHRTGTMEATEALLLAPPRFLLAGDPGSGKTTLGRHFVYQLASRAPASRVLARAWAPNRVAVWVRRLGLRRLADAWTRFPVPLFLPLSQLTASPAALREQLVKLLEPGGFPDPGAYLERHLQAGSCALFLDALDEIMDESTREKVARAVNGLAQQLDGNLIVVTCRIAGLSRARATAHDTGGEASALWGLDTEFKAFRKLELQELSPDQVKAFLERWFADSDRDPEQLWKALSKNDRLRFLTPNPLLLALVCLVYERDVRLPERRVELYQRAAEDLLAGLYVDKELPSPPYDLATQQRALGALAVGLHQAGVRQAGRSLLARRLRRAFPDWSATRREALLDWLVGRGELIRRQSRDTYAFGHFTFQEFFAAWHFRAKRNLRPLLARAMDPWWREVLLLLVGLLPDATRVLEELRKRSLPMAAEALAEARVAGTEAFVRVGQGIVRDLQEDHQRGGSAGIEAAEALARLPGWGARDYLLAQAQAEGGQAALTAFLALLRTLDAEARRARWPKVGVLLQRLHRGLGSGVPEVDQAILSALDRLGYALVFVPAGEFLMGSEAGREEDERPQHSVRLSDYWMGKYPVTNEQFAIFVAETEHPCQGDWRRHFSEGKERHPVVEVSWGEALAFCQWAGLTLPSEAEWEKAARGSDGREYPWGDTWDATRCNTREGGAGGTTPVGDYVNGTSPYGCHDMAGNVWEWTRSVYRPYPYDVRDGRELLNAAGDRVLRGGSWFDDRNIARCAYRYWDSPNSRDAYLGFRVVVSPF